MQLYLKRSKALLVFLLVTHLAAVLLLMLSRIDVVLTLPLLCMVGLQLGFYCRYYGWLDRDAAVKMLKLDEEGRCAVTDYDQRQEAGFHLQRGVILGPLMVLYLNKTGQRLSRALVIPRDAVDGESWRKLNLIVRNRGQ